MTAMPKTFKIGEHVRWNSEAGRVSGIIIKKITSDMNFKGYSLPESLRLTLILALCVAPAFAQIAGYTDDNPSVSPDGKKIAFISDRDGDIEIYVTNVDGSNPRRLTHSPGRDAHPEWSPDGQKIYFQSPRETKLPQVFVMNADGSSCTARHKVLGCRPTCTALECTTIRFSIGRAYESSDRRNDSGAVPGCGYTVRRPRPKHWYMEIE
jgi:dipeptidyl aminopeptidase/acylaminoacyl peptidase